MDTSLKELANCIRALAMDAVEKAGNGHPGMPMGMADVATVLYKNHLKFDPKNPTWPDRDRFILSAGHGSMLIYALNYLTGYEKMTLEEIKNFRQMGSVCAGHPEVDHEAGIETTTGPLGQGIATAVGFALAERILNAQFGDDIVNHKTWVIASDGDLMEGISHEAASLAGHLALKNLIVLYDDNGISIDGSTDLAFTDDTVMRFNAYHWATKKVNGHDFAELDAAMNWAKQQDRPVLIACKSTIGYGAPNKAGTSGVHGSALGPEEVKAARETLIWPHEAFVIPQDLLDQWREIGRKGGVAGKKWHEKLEKSGKKQNFLNRLIKTPDLKNAIKEIKDEQSKLKPKLATRAASGVVLEKLIPTLPQLVGGSADLTGSVNTKTKQIKIVTKNDYNGQYIHYGVREHGMAAAMNGMALHGGIIPYSGTFLQFADYSRPSIRIGALMKTRVIHVMTHDSIGLGEDGPTHQPVEHLAALRAIPNLYVFRPCDVVEAAESWECALNLTHSPSILALSRQAVPFSRNIPAPDNLVSKGGYILSDHPEPLIVLIATGTEVSIALDVQKKLEEQGIGARVVSMPCMELFHAQSLDYKAHVLNHGHSLPVGIEAGIRQGWDDILGPYGLFFGVSTFGESAPAEKLYEHFGLTPDNITKQVLNVLSQMHAHHHGHDHDHAEDGSCCGHDHKKHG